MRRVSQAVHRPGAARRWAFIACMIVCPIMQVKAQPLEHVCDASAVRAERDWDIPAGVLAAVGTVESGHGSNRPAPAPWPWTINAAGRGTFYASKQEAIAAVLKLMQAGYPYIDVGCFQIDLMYHPTFKSLDDAFDPERNAQVAAQILAELRRVSPDWATAVARYHSANPALGTPYLDRVRAVFTTARTRAAAAEFSEALFTGAMASAQNDPGTPPDPRLPRVIYPVAAFAAAADGSAGPQIFSVPSSHTPAATIVPFVGNSPK